MGLAILFLCFFGSMCLGVPITFSLAGSALVAMLYEDMPLWLVFQRMTDGVQIFSLLAIPFFIFAGEMMLQGKIAQKLVDFALVVFGWMRGGLGVVNVFASMLFGGISGSAVADTSALGSILIPLMKKSGYDTDYAVNVTVTSSVAGVIIPPSHNMILFAVAAGSGISIIKLFLAGIVPGVLMCVCLAGAAYAIAVRRGYRVENFPGFRAALIIAVQAVPGLLTAVIIIGGVLFGVATVTESAAVGAIYAIVIVALVYRNLNWPMFKICLANSFRMTAKVMMVVASAQGFAWLMTVYDVPVMMMTMMGQVSDEPMVIFLLINIILLVLGMVMDMGPLILICTPIFLPVMINFGMDPLQFGIIMMMNLGLGLCTPPVGTLLFVGCAIGEIEMEQTIKTVWPFYVAMLIALLLVTYVPAVSLTIPMLLD